MYDFFSTIDLFRIQLVYSFFVNQLLTFKEDDINFIKIKLPKSKMP